MNGCVTPLVTSLRLRRRIGQLRRSRLHPGPPLSCAAPASRHQSSRRIRRMPAVWSGLGRPQKRSDAGWTPVRQPVGHMARAVGCRTFPSSACSLHWMVTRRTLLVGTHRPPKWTPELFPTFARDFTLTTTRKRPRDCEEAASRRCDAPRRGRHLPPKCSRSRARLPRPEPSTTR